MFILHYNFRYIFLTCILVLAVQSNCGQIFAGEVSGAQRGIWGLAGSPYTVVGDIVIPAGETLEIKPGVVVKFTGYYSIQVHGTLIANGGVADRIVFTSMYDNEFGRLGTPSRKLPSQRDWRGIEFRGENHNTSSLVYCIVRYSDQAVIAKSSRPALRNLIITDCNTSKLILNGQTIAVVDGVAHDYGPGGEIEVVTRITNEATPHETAAPANNTPANNNTSLPAEPEPEATSFTTDAKLFGIVSDEETGERLPGANIELIPEGIEGQATGAASGANGEFEIDSVVPGIYMIMITYVGYDKKTLGNVELAPGMTKGLEITLTHIGLQLNPVIVTASRRPEKVFEAPAAITLLEDEQLQKTTISPVEHLKNVPAVDFAATGINQANVVVRGFNNVFSGALLALTDNRIAGLPSLRFNAYNLIPPGNDDLERIEIVSGPGAALYGPNSANGVLHLITKSPFGSEGTTVSAGGGERIEFIGAFRHANSFNDRIGYRISGQYYRGVDWPYRDPAEPEFFSVNGQNVPSPGRDFNVTRFSADGRVDFRPITGMTTIVSAGVSQISDIELTGIGAAQAVDWRFSYAQGRLYYKNFFAQAYLNMSDAGDTFLLRTGAPIIDKSTLMAGHVQHGITLFKRQRFTYGLDYLQTKPSTGGTINNRHEAYDRIDEKGAFLQSETAISSKLDLILAARLDDHTFIKKQVASSRAALLLKPQTNHAVRFTFNQAYGTPTANNLFLDILSASVPTRALNPLLEPFVGPVFFNLYAEGTAPRRGGFLRQSRGGFTFRYDNAQRPQMISLFGPALGMGNAYLPPDVNAVWPALRTIILAAQPPGPNKDALSAALPQNLSAQVPGIFRAFNPATRAFDAPVTTVTNIPLTKPTTTTTFEVGYKGLLGQRLLASVDVYRSRVRDFVGPLIVETPHVFIDPAALAPVLAHDLTANGFSAALAQATAQSLAQSLAELPLGLLSPQEIQNATDVILTYRNFGDVSFYGTDISFNYNASRSWRFGLNYSFVSKDFFAKSAKQPHDIALNAPKHKLGASVHYNDVNTGLDGEFRVRYVEGFPVNSGVYIGAVQTYTLADLDVGYAIGSNTRTSLAVQNVFDQPYRAFVGAPIIGRLMILRLVQSF